MTIGRTFVKTFIKRNTSLLIVVVCAVVLVMCNLKQSVFLSKWNQYLSQIVFPIKKSIHEVVQFIQKLPQITNIWHQSSQLIQENKQLKCKLLQLTQQGSKDVLCKRKNVITGQVLGYEDGIFSSTMLINTIDSVDIGHIVTTDSGLVGVVTAMANDIALVTTVTDMRIAVPVKNKRGTHLVLKGQNKNSMISVAVQQGNALPKSSVPDIKVGDVLYTSGEGGIFKINIPVAKVVTVTPEITAKPIVDMNNVEYVNLSVPVWNKGKIIGK